MRRGCLTTLGFFGAAIVSWFGLAFYLWEPRPPSDNGGYAMGMGMFMLTGGALIAAVIGLFAAMLVWAYTRPPDE